MTRAGLQIHVYGFKSRLHLRAIGAVGARFPDTEEVTGSNPVSPTSNIPSQHRFCDPERALGGLDRLTCRPDFVGLSLGIDIE